MRERPNKNGLAKTYTVGKSCDICKIDFYPGQEIGVDPEQEMSVCENCGDKVPDGNWYNHIYNLNKEYNTYYCINNEKAFENFIGEKIFNK